MSIPTQIGDTQDIPNKWHNPHKMHRSTASAVIIQNPVQLSKTKCILDLQYLITFKALRHFYILDFLIPRGKPVSTDSSIELN